ncbi:alpha-keto acid decarboxylase family protein [Tuwongella immobilis]|uniref:Uncharacterized protein n=1 Tax=Tuwongella immobilis TaxID=692036 RepID=A0A6C2YQ86_9BACT|nr:thiamine pyrophosphate-binding protein [Tuwongella immobilis]VIP03636.1 preprotein translocase subunit tim44 : Pyruvate decarboxylase OS=Planctomyces brasiliensis (strain ATCC 49424 / DSM 5305 / JCM 21570 / NBRC 103401 / IFAM 1448) GN=Plabr_0335 PE=3 SV=1: TPP_enzyme_N: TPP_enzyme_M: TPP_enzyme_C [Tuwongella immobilis]VTS04640.1 preprotein translocase subunit tim44 : Pyruvate decarboxylase OS=Planctomyces brasiliensis (strain ATCC 49424 / DSM 5305 / JCM 21570 / NBRC 103401 / IFAM 1448) GN=Plab
MSSPQITSLAESQMGQAHSVEATSIGQYLLDRLRGLGVDQMFGIPGDYVLSFFKMVEESPVEMVVTTNELAAGYAADAYARIRGLGVACITYAVGAFSLTNAVAGAYAEQSPLVIISGSPGTREVKRNRLLHHMVGDSTTQMDVFKNITVAQALLDDPLTAFREIDRVLDACLRFKRPVYLEIPRDRVHTPPIHPHRSFHEEPVSDPDELREAVAETLEMLKKAKRPVILAGIEINRYRLADRVLKLAERHRIPISATLLSKSVFPERHPLYLGVYQAAMGRQEVTQYVENSDCLLMLGAMITDTDTGIFTHQLNPDYLVFATSEQVQIRYHHYEDILLEDFVAKLDTSELPIYEPTLPKSQNPIDQPYATVPNTVITVRRLFQKLNSILDANSVVIADPGDALFGAADLSVQDSAEFLGSAFYATLGWAVPAAIGAQKAAPSRRPIVLVGDGAFQMTGFELGTTKRFGLNPIVIVLNNKGYLTERFLLEGRFNDIPNWQYHRLPEVIGHGRGYEVFTESDLDRALESAWQNSDSFSLLNVHLAPTDHSPGLARLGENLSKRV